MQAIIREPKKCLKCGFKFSKKLHESHLQFDLKKYCGRECQSKAFVGFKMPREIVDRLSKQKTGKPAWWKKGELNYFWRGGKTPEILAERMSLRYKNWRRQVFERDDYVCQDCGLRGGKLNADHIKSFTHFPSIRYELSNGRTLCVACHIKTPTFGGRSRT